MLKPATLIAFHRALKERKYRRLLSPQRRGKPGPKGPSKELVQAIVEITLRMSEDCTAALKGVWHRDKQRALSCMDAPGVARGKLI